MKDGRSSLEATSKTRLPKGSPASLVSGKQDQRIL
jgi:hypothetical protein